MANFLERVSGWVYGLITLLFLIIGLLPYMLNAISHSAAMSDPAVQGSVYLAVLIFVVAVVYALFFRKDETAIFPMQ